VGGGHMDPHILSLYAKWIQVISFIDRPLYPQGKSYSYPFRRRLWERHETYGCFGEEKGYLIITPTIAHIENL